jgi:hypothetical protein
MEAGGEPGILRSIRIAAAKALEIRGEHLLQHVGVENHPLDALDIGRRNGQRRVLEKGAF